MTHIFLTIDHLFIKKDIYLFSSKSLLYTLIFKSNKHKGVTF